MDIGIESWVLLLDLVNSYLMIDGKTTRNQGDPLHPYENRDRGFKTVVILVICTWAGLADGKYYSTEGIKVYFSKDDVAEPQNSKTEINYILIRYADILLMYAEAQNEAVGLMNQFILH